MQNLEKGTVPENGCFQLCQWKKLSVFLVKTDSSNVFVALLHLKRLELGVFEGTKADVNNVISGKFIQH